MCVANFETERRNPQGFGIRENEIMKRPTCWMQFVSPENVRKVLDRTGVPLLHVCVSASKVCPLEMATSELNSQFVADDEAIYAITKSAAWPILYSYVWPAVDGMGM